MFEQIMEMFGRKETTVITPEGITTIVERGPDIARVRYSEALMTEMLQYMVDKRLMPKADAQGIIDRAKKRVTGGK